jgi:hypothetical protein
VLVHVCFHMCFIGACCSYVCVCLCMSVGLLSMYFVCWGVGCLFLFVVESCPFPGVVIAFYLSCECTYVLHVCFLGT